MLREFRNIPQRTLLGLPDTVWWCDHGLPCGQQLVIYHKLQGFPMLEPPKASRTNFVPKGPEGVENNHDIVTLVMDFW